MGVLTDIAGRVLRLELARPEKKNALTGEMYAQLATALAAAGNDPRVRAVLLCAQGSVFCAGNDLEDFQRRAAGADDTPAAALDFMQALLATELPVVVAVQGAAVGIGATLLMHCDLVYCAEDASFRLPFVSLGLCAEFGSSLTLPLAAGHHLAAEKLLLGEPISVEEALQMRLVNRVLPATQLQAFAQQQATRLAQQPPAALRATKRLMKQAWQAQIGRQVRDEYAEFLRLLRGAEAREALQAFFARRAPDFSRFD